MTEKEIATHNHLVYSIELARRITDTHIQMGLISEDLRQMIFDSLVDGFSIRKTNEIVQALLDLGSEVVTEENTND